MESLEVRKVKGVDLKDVTFDEHGYLTKGGLIKELKTCIRPGHRTLAYQVWAEIYKGKIISHNYGHGGIGFCVCFGSVNRAIENAEKLAGNQLKKDDEITVIGLGIIGLATAMKLHLLGYTNIRLVGQSFGEGNPSFGAAAFITLGFAEVQNDPYTQQLFREDFAETCREYKKIIDGKHEYITEGVRWISVYSNEDYSNEGLKGLLQNEVLEEPKKVHLQLDTNDRFFEMYHLRTFHIKADDFMNNYFNVLTKKLKMPVEVKKVKSFEEISSKIIFNCTGLGAKELARDPDLVPISGHCIILNSDVYGNLDYVLNLNRIESLGVQGINGHVYFSPKNTGFIGGTYIVGDRGKNHQLNKRLVTKIINNARYIFNGIKPAKEIDMEMVPKF